MGYSEMEFYRRILALNINSSDYEMVLIQLAESITDMYRSTMGFNDVMSMLHSFEYEIESAGV